MHGNTVVTLGIFNYRSESSTAAEGLVQHCVIVVLRVK